MSLAGFRATNHPQQTGKRGAVDATDDRAITWEDFNPLHERFRFTIDAAASATNARLPRYWTTEDDALTQSWASERVWCNPPYSNLGEWIAKAWLSWAEGCQLIVMLVPANRTEQAWWQNGIEHVRDGRGDSPLRVEFLPGRMRFERPNAVIGPKGDRPPFGCCLLIWGQS